MSHHTHRFCHRPTQLVTPSSVFCYCTFIAFPTILPINYRLFTFPASPLYCLRRHRCQSLTIVPIALSFRRSFPKPFYSISHRFPNVCIPPTCFLSHPQSIKLRCRSPSILPTRFESLLFYFFSHRCSRFSDSPTELSASSFHSFCHLCLNFSVLQRECRHHLLSLSSSLRRPSCSKKHISRTHVFK